MKNNPYSLLMDEHIKKSNEKTLLCKSVIDKTTCRYGKKCLFAHSLKEQHINPCRKIIYDIMKFKRNIKNLNIDKETFDTILILTKLCYKCVENKCKGGLNCRLGAVSVEYQICYDDFVHGKCDNKLCKLFHFTSIGYKRQEPVFNNVDNISELSELSDNDIINITEDVGKSIFDVDLMSII